MKNTFFQIAQQRAWRRREFLRSAAGVSGAAVMSGHSPLHTAVQRKRQKRVVVTFGGGARDEETFAPQGQENAPHLLSELIPQATFCPQVVNRGILGHYVATASLVTGVYETFDNCANVAPNHPTILEYYRKGLGRPLNDVWVIAPSTQAFSTTFVQWSAREALRRARPLTMLARFAPNRRWHQ